MIVLILLLSIMCMGLVVAGHDLVQGIKERDYLKAIKNGLLFIPPLVLAFMLYRLHALITELSK